MKHDHQAHLSYEEQLKAMIDVSDLEPSRRRHLEGCDACRMETSRIESRYRRLGEIAEAMAPAPRRPFRLPQGTRRVGGRRFRPLWAAGALAAVLLMIMVWRTGPLWLNGGPDAYTVLTGTDDRQLMAEIDALIENALPQPYRELAAVAEHGSNFDEDLINWIVPSIEEDDSLT